MKEAYNEKKTFSILPEEQIEIIHSPFFPADVRKGEGVTAYIRTSSNEKWTEIRVWRFSPLGVELLVEKEKHSSLSFKADQSVDIKIKLLKQETEFEGLVILSEIKHQNNKLIGVRWCHRGNELKKSWDGVNRRKAKRFVCHERFLPTGTAGNPSRFNDFIVFRICDFSKDGIGLMTSLRNKFIVEGMVLNTQISFPLVGNFPVDIKIETCRFFESQNSSEGYLWIGASILNQSKVLNHAIADYLFQFGSEASIAELRAEGLKVKKASTALEFGCVRTKEDFVDVINLRKLAYTGAGKISNEGEFDDIFDARARIITARHRGNLVGSIRLIFHEDGDDLEHERFFNYRDFDSLPRKSDLVEVTRICTHPNYRKSDILYALMKEMTLQVVQSGRKFVLGSAEEKLMRLYLSMGYKGEEIYFEHEDINNIKHQLLIGHVPTILSGKGVDVKVWNELYKDLTEFINNNDFLSDDPLTNVRQNTYRILSPFTKILTRGVRHPKSLKKQATSLLQGSEQPKVLERR